MSDKQKNVLGQDLEQCSLNPLTGWYRDGCCNTDEKIDELVDSVRMPKIDRDLLKARLKARRDYIASQVLTEMAMAS